MLKKVTRLEFCLLLVVQILFHCLSGTEGQNQNILKDHPTICMTPECIHTASNLLTEMHPEVDPCDNFYQFSCGKFFNRSKLVEEYSTYIDKYVELNEKIIQEMQFSLGEIDPFPQKSKALRLGEKMYRSCLETFGNYKRMRPFLLKILNESGGWPVVAGQAWNEDDFDWIKSTQKLYNMGVTADFFMEMSIGVDEKNHTRSVIYLDRCSKINFPVDNDWSEHTRIIINKAYYALGRRNRAQGSKFIPREMEEAINFQKEMLNISFPEKEVEVTSEDLYNPMTISELSKTYSSIPWKEFFNGIIGSNGEIDDNDVIIVRYPKYIEELEKLVKKTPKKVLANYMMGIVAAKMYLPFGKYKWKECIDIVRKQMPVSASYLHLLGYFNNKTKMTVQDIFNNVHDEVINIFENIDWMDDDTKKNAVDKAKSITSLIAYYDEVFNITLTDEFYKDLEFDDKDWLENSLRMKKFLLKNSFNDLKKPFDRDNWRTFLSPTLKISPVHSSDPHLRLPAGIFQGPFFNNDRPMYMNYGTTGSNIARELIHIVNKDIFNHKENKNEVGNWRTQDFYEKYRQMVECIFEQELNNLVMGKINMENVTEIIADMGVFKASYSAYKNWSTKNSKELELPGFPYNTAQMFWISAGNMMCAAVHENDEEKNIQDSYNLMRETLVLKTFANIPEFLHDFKCSENSNMYPKKMCVFW